MTVAAAAFAGLILCGCGAQKRLRIGACDAHRNGAALVTRYVIVYGARTAAPAITTYYACLRPAGKAVRIGVDEPGSVYGSDATTGSFRAAGTYIAAQSSTGEATLAICARYSNIRRCPQARHWLTLVDAKSGREVRLPVYRSPPVRALVPFPVTLALSPNGAVAWLQNRTADANVTSSLQLWATALTARGRPGLAAAPTIIDTGAGDPSSLRLERRTLHWSRDRVQHRRELHCAPGPSADRYRTDRRRPYRRRLGSTSRASPSSSRTPTSLPRSYTRPIGIPCSSSSPMTTAGKSIPPARRSANVTGAPPARRRRSSISSCRESATRIAGLVPAGRRHRFVLVLVPGKPPCATWLSRMTR